MRLRRFLPLLLLPVFFWQCFTGGGISTPPATSGSDAKAILVANDVLNAQGGKQAWDNTRYIRWNFFGSRTLLWDKHAGMCRIDWAKRPLKVIVNLNDGSGRVWINNVPQSQPDTLAKYLKMGKEVWINDSYWLVMPYKMLDQGVTLRYLGEAQDDAKANCHLLEMTFKNVGVTPDNKYQVWVDKQQKLVAQWAFFTKNTDAEPRFKSPWRNYKRYGNIQLSDNRGEGRSLAPVEVLETVPADAFEGAN